MADCENGEDEALCIPPEDFGNERGAAPWECIRKVLSTPFSQSAISYEVLQRRIKSEEKPIGGLRSSSGVVLRFGFSIAEVIAGAFRKTR